MAFCRALKREGQDKAGLHAGGRKQPEGPGGGQCSWCTMSPEVALSSLWGPTAGGGGPWTRTCLWWEPPAQPVCERPLWMPTGQARTEVAGRTRTSHGGPDCGGGPGGLSQLQPRRGSRTLGPGRGGGCVRIGCSLYLLIRRNRGFRENEPKPSDLGQDGKLLPQRPER